jgi:hypothetical protein
VEGRDHDRIASVAYDSTLRIWDGHTGALIRAITSDVGLCNITALQPADGPFYMVTPPCFWSISCYVTPGRVVALFYISLTHSDSDHRAAVFGHIYGPHTRSARDTTMAARWQNYSCENKVHPLLLLAASHALRAARCGLHRCIKVGGRSERSTPRSSRGAKWGLLALLGDVSRQAMGPVIKQARTCTSSLSALYHMSYYHSWSLRGIHTSFLRLPRE